MDIFNKKHKVQYSTSLDGELVDALKKFCKKHKLKANEVIEHVLTEFLNEHKNTKDKKNEQSA